METGKDSSGLRNRPLCSPCFPFVLGEAGSLVLSERGGVKDVGK